MTSSENKQESSLLDSENTNENPGSDGWKPNRRTFMKASAAGAAAVTVAGLSLKGGSTLLATMPSSSTSSSDPFALRAITLNVNGKNYSLSVEPRAMLVNVLRENLNLVGTKRPCNRMECGGCTVLIDNTPIYSCTYLAVRAAQGQKILTVEGTSTDNVLSAVQSAWVTADASQCGYCQSGRVMAATALLKNNPNPSVAQIQGGLEGILCRCGTYINVIEAVQAAAKSLGGAQ